MKREEDTARSSRNKLVSEVKSIYKTYVGTKKYLK
jgi:hypothetical protein